MPLVAKDLFERARRILLDESSVRWPLAELTTWLNDAQRAVALHKPNATAKNIVQVLVPGTRQALPAGYLALLNVVRNLKTNQDSPRLGGRMVRVVERAILDTQLPDWHDSDVTPFTAVAKHFIYDELDPKTFYVYPGNDGTGFLEVVASKVPDVIVATGGVEDLASYNVALDVDDVYFNPLLHYILFRAYSKDADFSISGAQAQAFYTLFANDLGIKVNAELMTSPNARAGVQSK